MISLFKNFQKKSNPDTIDVSEYVSDIISIDGCRIEEKNENKLHLTFHFKNSLNNSETTPRGGDNGGSQGGLINLKDLSYKLATMVHQMKSDNLKIDQIYVTYKQYDRKAGEIKTHKLDISKRISQIQYIGELGNYGYYLNPDFELHLSIERSLFDESIFDIFHDVIDGQDNFELSRVYLPMRHGDWHGADDNYSINNVGEWAIYGGVMQVVSSPSWNKQFLFQLKNAFYPRIRNIGWDIDITIETMGNGNKRYFIELIKK